jgi:hypothetical protein
MANLVAFALEPKEVGLFKGSRKLGIWLIWLPLLKSSKK